MKKVFYVLTMIFAVALMSTSCDPIEDPTLEDLNPEWVNLSWVSTDGYNDAYPQLTITIQGNDVIVALTKLDNNDNEYVESQTYNEFSVGETEEGDVVIGDVYSGTTYFDGTYRIDYSETPTRVTLEVNPTNPYYDDYRYVLEMN